MFSGKVISDESGILINSHILSLYNSKADTINAEYIEESILDFEANAAAFEEVPAPDDQELAELLEDFDRFLENGGYNNNIIGEALLPMNGS